MEEYVGKKLKLHLTLYNQYDYDIETEGFPGLDKEFYAIDKSGNRFKCEAFKEYGAFVLDQYHPLFNETLQSKILRVSELV